MDIHQLAKEILLDGSKRFAKEVKQDEKQKKRKGIRASRREAWKRHIPIELWQRLRKEIYIDRNSGHIMRETSMARRERTGEEYYEMGQLSKRCHITGSIMFEVEHEDERFFLPLTRFAYWIAQKVDAGGDRFSKTGGVRQKKVHDPRNMRKSNLITVNSYARWKAKADLTAILAMYRVKDVPEFDSGPDPVRTFVDAVGYSWLKQFEANPLTGVLLHRGYEFWKPAKDGIGVDGSGFVPHIRRHRKTMNSRPGRVRSPLYVLPFVGKKGMFLPAANVMWFLATGTFGGQIIHLDDNYSNLKIDNLMPEGLIKT